MGVRDYGIWKGTPVLYEFEDRYEDHDSPHLSLYYHDNEGDPPGFDRDFRRNNRGHPPNPNHPKEIPGLFRAAINIKSTDDETRLAYWVKDNMEDHLIVQKLTGLDFDFNPINSVPELNGEGLDYIRGNLFNSRSGRVLLHDIPGTNNDIIDVLEPEITKAIEKKATIYLFGSKFDTNNGIHEVHMNQGNIGNFTHSDGVFQDGGLLIQYEDHWTGIFIAFASQAIHTDDNTGHKIPGNTLTWGDFLPKDIEENSVTITKALVNPRERDDSSARDKESVTLENFTNRRVSLSSWTLRNSAGDVQELPQNAVLAAGESKDFDVPNCPLDNNGDTITLCNKEGLRVDGVSYRRRQGQTEGHSIVFTH
ncbi:hypothetical protein PCG10_005949 [Penicillium crustosum]|uniref:LTD domain-containing protein n=1 Tax=Penicillium crustosum TaxID=36656 RepID=A0A9P5GIJ1_PENCR|nr:uncharacterized protein N7487_007414 [Penicillium crustosum]KAF7524256.1 hypothetical protein PCG10_005949 [Penicillium crustosum]KAJ5401518.1 hypothetical protein N7487_007414 [Penicillium crustosum]